MTAGETKKGNYNQKQSDSTRGCDKLPHRSFS